MIEEKQLIKNLHKVYLQHDVTKYNQLINFYPLALNTCKNISIKYNVSLQQVVGILSCLSPRLRFSRNITATELFLQGHRNLHTGVVMKKCSDILKTTNESEIVKIINGIKTTNFYYNIMYPTNTEYITIDRHILRVLHNDNIIRVTNKEYGVFKSAIVKAAKKVKLSPVQYQSIVWHVFRDQINSRTKLKEYK